MSDGFRVLTYNIHKCVGGLDRRYDPERVSLAISHFVPDIVFLQEVAAALEDQAGVVAQKLGLRHRIFVPHVPRRGGGHYGNAILSRHPIRSAEHIDLTIPPKKRRGVLHARIRIRSKDGSSRTLHAYNLHLGLSGIERRIQLRRFVESRPFAHLHARTPIVLGGDFNDVWGTLGKAVLIPAGFHGTHARLPTFPSFAPVRALDAIYLRGDLSFREVHRGDTELAKRASDHRPVIADIAFRA
ncbi:MAG: endonuclease/exonuclease/phosphatase family protein [Elusimicrobia bacterium]|nr:endonuclease/exonuclease/phosphatase family protein [Elusimicrobiota bacterium]